MSLTSREVSKLVGMLRQSDISFVDADLLVALCMGNLLEEAITPTSPSDQAISIFMEDARPDLKILFEEYSNNIDEKFEEAYPHVEDDDEDYFRYVDELAKNDAEFHRQREIVSAIDAFDAQSPGPEDLFGLIALKEALDQIMIERTFNGIKEQRVKFIREKVTVLIEALSFKFSKEASAEAETEENDTSG